MEGPRGEGSYTFAAAPQPVGRASKYRNGGGSQRAGPINIMADPRVIRGNTYAAHVLPAEAGHDPEELRRRAEARRARRARRQQRALEREPRTPPPVEGRLHRDIQTDLYLEEITEQAVEKDAAVQTDQFLDRPPSPVFIPKKLGIDATTQIHAGDLFHFDVEVQPILEVIVGKTLQQALLEVMQEEELENMRAHQREFLQLRDAELAETQRLEEAERRRHEEKERRMQQERVRIEMEKEARDKVAARAYAATYVADLVGNVFDGLGSTGFFYDEVERDVETAFVPWLMERVGANLTRLAVAQDMADALIGSAVAKRAIVRAQHEEAVAAAAAKAAAEAAAAAAAAEAEAAAAALARAEAGEDEDDADADADAAEGEYDYEDGDGGDGYEGYYDSNYGSSSDY